MSVAKDPKAGHIEYYQLPNKIDRMYREYQFCLYYLVLHLHQVVFQVHICVRP